MKNDFLARVIAIRTAEQMADMQALRTVTPEKPRTRRKWKKVKKPASTKAQIKAKNRAYYAKRTAMLKARAVPQR